MKTLKELVNQIENDKKILKQGKCFKGDYGFIACLKSLKEGVIYKDKNLEEKYLHAINVYLKTPFSNSMMVTACEYLLGLFDLELNAVVETKLKKHQ